MQLPQFDTGSTVLQLHASIFAAHGYVSDLAISPHVSLSKNQPTTIYLLDGVGYEYMQQQNDMLSAHIIGEVSSLFPSVTHNVLASLYTLTEPKNHAHIAYNNWKKERMLSTHVFLYQTFGTNVSLDHFPVEAKDLYPSSSVYNSMSSSVTVFQPAHIAGPVNALLHAGANIVGYDSLEHLSSLLLSDSSDVQLVYYDRYDGISHEHGPYSHEAQQAYTEAARMIESVYESTGRASFVYSDHGFIDTQDGKLIDFASDEFLTSRLHLPVIGEPRIAMLYIKPRFLTEVLHYMQDTYGMYGDCIDPRELQKQGVFGIGSDEHPYFDDRLGDLWFVMKDNHMCKDSRVSGLPHLKGMHGGWSPQEMRIPVVFLPEKI